MCQMRKRYEKKFRTLKAKACVCAQVCRSRQRGKKEEREDGKTLMFSSWNTTEDMRQNGDVKHSYTG